ncbi:MAG: flagellar biosynthetic protein FliO [Pseudomonadales bacterium]|nr:flagellar biosynthetic protein FliO [Pseudomonadales bacterium]
MNARIVPGFAAVLAPTCSAAELAAAPGAGDALRVFLALGLVLAVIVAIAAIARRSGRLPGTSTRLLRVVDSLALTSKEKLVVVDAGGERLVLGVAPGRVSRLHVLAGEAVALAPEAEVSFAEGLRAVVASTIGREPRT